MRGRRGGRDGPFLELLVVLDAGPRTGLGHLMRCRALVEAIRRRARRGIAGAPCGAAEGGAGSGSGPRPRRGGVRARGRRLRVRVAFLGRFGPQEKRRIAAWGYLPLDGRRGRANLPALRRATGGASPDVAIFDAYRSLEAEMRAARSAGSLIVYFDDQDRSESSVADVVIAPNRAAAPRAPRLSSGGASRRIVLAGPRYLCVRPEVMRLAARGGWALRRRSGAARVFVSLGGGRAPGLARLVGALRRARLPVEEWVVAGGGETGGAGEAGVADEPAGAVQAGGTGRAGGRIRRAQEPLQVARAMARCTAAVSAAGTTAWELACLGVPSVLIARVANQLPIARLLDRRAAVWCRGLAPTTTAVTAALRRLLADRTLRARLARGGRRLVDGRGAERAAAVIFRRLGSRPGWPPARAGAAGAARQAARRAPGAIVDKRRRSD